ncbi:hypothetical protein L1049_007931 [Liquidambar formosana]|uniref:RNase H type-1 domain-containing protein n=1 Tax=Liquidambar formosana TaxID=63359 RepID=A0AAP0S8N3_LIQFO
MGLSWHCAVTEFYLIEIVHILFFVLLVRAASFFELVANVVIALCVDSSVLEYVPFSETSNFRFRCDHHYANDGVVVWSPLARFTFNCDGSFSSNKAGPGSGVILCKHIGRFIDDCGSPISCCSARLSEALAIQENGLCSLAMSMHFGKMIALSSTHWEIKFVMLYNRSFISEILVGPCRWVHLLMEQQIGWLKQLA